MTVHSSPMIPGAGGEPISTGSSAALSPSEFATACSEIVRQHDGHAAHKALDELVTKLLSSLGYGDGMVIFIASVAPFHDQPGTPNAKENSVPRRSCPNRNPAASGRAEGRVGVSSDISDGGLQ